MAQDKIRSLNELLAKGYSICFVLDRLVNDYITNAEFEDFREILEEKFPDPTDTTGTYRDVPVPPPPVVKEKPCRILRLISKPS